MPSDGPKPFRHVPAQARQAAAKSLIAGHNEFDEGETTAGMSKGCAPRYDYGSKVAGEARVRRVGSFDYWRFDDRSIQAPHGRLRLSPGAGSSRRV